MRIAYNILTGKSEDNTWDTNVEHGRIQLK